MLQSSFDVTSFVSEVVFLKMLSRQERNERNDVRNTFKFETMFQNWHGHPTAIHNIHSDFSDLGMNKNQGNK